jgi:hypothetical protein
MMEGLFDLGRSDIIDIADAVRLSAFALDFLGSRSCNQCSALGGQAGGVLRSGSLFGFQLVAQRLRIIRRQCDDVGAPVIDLRLYAGHQANRFERTGFFKQHDLMIGDTEHHAHMVTRYKQLLVG